MEIALRVLAHLCGLDQTVTDGEIASLRAWADGSEALDEVARRIIRREIDRKQFGRALSKNGMGRLGPVR